MGTAKAEPIVNLYYDAAVLGIAQSETTARTGVFRVVERVVLGLLSSQAVNMKLCSSVGNDQACRDYLRQNRVSAGYDANLLARLHYYHGLSDRQSLWKCLRGKLSRSLPEPFVYHSPYHVIPEPIRRRSDISKVLTVHDLIAVLFPQYFSEDTGRHCREMLASLTPDTTVICNSESTRNDLCNRSTIVDPSRVFVTHLAASELFFPCQDQTKQHHIRQKYGIPGDAGYFLSVCTLEPRKNIDRVIRSFAELVRQQYLADLFLVLTGTKGWKFENIFDEIDNATSLRDRIIVTGYVADEDLATLYSGALAFVYPSMYEGFGLPPLEAMQCGTPVITSNTSSLPEVVGEAGIMLAPQDNDALCQAMYDLYRNAWLRKELAIKGIKQAAKFSWQRCVSETISVYRAALQH